MEVIAIIRIESIHSVRMMVNGVLKVKNNITKCIHTIKKHAEKR